MADTKISALPLVTVIDGSEYVALVQSGVTSKLPIGYVFQVMGSGDIAFALGYTPADAAYDQSFVGLLGGPGAIAVSGAVTATLGRMHDVSGTNYTIALPPVAGNNGKMLGFTTGGIITLDGDGSEEIDGQPTRVMGLAEHAVLRCDGTRWLRCVRHAVPLMAGLLRNAASTVTTATATKIDLNEGFDGNAGFLMADDVAHRINIVRTNEYLITAQVKADGANAITLAKAMVYQNGSPITSSARNLAATEGFFYSRQYRLDAGDYVELYVSHTSGANRDFGGAVLDRDSCLLSVVEIPSW